MKTEWTKEEYLKQRTAEHAEGGASRPYACALAVSDAKALEDFGVQWAPEPEPWPGEIAYGVDAGGEPRLALSGSTLRRRRVHGEACRRWRGYGKLAEFVKKVSQDVWSVSSEARLLLRELGEEVPK